jgi:hypothetical protein
LLAYLRKYLDAVLDFIEILNKKSCDGCTKCCEGYLSANIKGHDMGQGIPCPLVIKNVGCGEYETRPYNPCVVFQCEWRRNPYFDEWLAPIKTNVIFVRQIFDGFEYIQITEAGSPATEEVIAWAKNYAEEHRMNFEWKVDGVSFVVGSAEFVKAMINS